MHAPNRVVLYARYSTEPALWQRLKMRQEN